MDLTGISPNMMDKWPICTVGKRCLTLLVSREMKIKITKTYYLAPQHGQNKDTAQQRALSGTQTLGTLRMPEEMEIVQLT